MHSQYQPGAPAGPDVVFMDVILTDSEREVEISKGPRAERRRTFPGISEGAPHLPQLADVSGEHSFTLLNSERFSILFSTPEINSSSCNTLTLALGQLGRSMDLDSTKDRRGLRRLSTGTPLCRSREGSACLRSFGNLDSRLTLECGDLNFRPRRRLREQMGTAQKGLCPHARKPRAPDVQHT